MLTVSNICKAYHGSPVLEDVTFEIPEGSIAGIIGPNGAGKSTVLRIVTGFETADRGKVRFRDRKISSFREKTALFSYMPERIEIYPGYRVRDFIAFIEKATRFENPELIETLRLGTVWHKKIRNLSKGYKQRLKLFTALSNRKPILVLDEPFDGFDPIQLGAILDLLRQENAGGRVFFLSIHQLSDAEKICDYYILLNEGRMVAQGTLETLRRKFGHETSTLEAIFMAALR